MWEIWVDAPTPHDPKIKSNRGCLVVKELAIEHKPKTPPIAEQFITCYRTPIRKSHLFVSKSTTWCKIGYKMNLISTCL